ncbi:MAG: hypothetical protein NZ928_02190 [Endomicrobia bacterium]|nr:hypothetical protein [Endomicrobiia bacterium]MDW8055806.1 hypothetical protein [Elusimicrobiota bacterium]
MNKKLFFLFFIFYCQFLLSQAVEFGIGFSPYDISVSTTYQVELIDDSTLKQILEYFYSIKYSSAFYNINMSEYNVPSSSATEENKYVVLETSGVLKLADIKKIVSGFGKSEIIKLFIIKHKSDKNPLLKDLVRDYKKLRSWTKLAEKYGLDYVNDIWLPSKEIYSKLFEVKEK